MLIIKSSNSDRELIFSDLRDDYFQVKLKGARVAASVNVYAYTDAKVLNNLFQKIGKLNKSWGGKEEWESIEGDFAISFTCDKLGHVTVQAMLKLQQGEPEEASIKANLAMDFGSLPSLAKEAQEFFRQL